MSTGGLDPCDVAAQTIHLDDLYDGWKGVEAGAARLVEQVLKPLSHGGRASYQRYDWATGEYAEWVTPAPSCWLIVEGVGAGARDIRPLLNALVWLEAPTALRRDRALRRDPGFAPHWERWAATEDDYLRRNDPRQVADVVLRHP